MNVCLRRQDVHQRARHVATLYYLKRGYVPDDLIAIVKAKESQGAFRRWILTHNLKSNPNQPHVPAGYTTGGQFTSDGTNGGELTGWGGKPEDFMDHYNKHSKDFGAISPQDYINKARDFYQRFLNEDLPAVQNPDGYSKIYDPNSNIFGVYNPDGDPVTFFKPTSPTYYDREVQNILDNGGKILNPISESDGGGGGGGGGFGIPTGGPSDIPNRRPWEIDE